MLCINEHCGIRIPDGELYCCAPCASAEEDGGAGEHSAACYESRKVRFPLTENRL